MLQSAAFPWISYSLALSSLRGEHCRKHLPYRADVWSNCHFPVAEELSLGAAGQRKKLPWTPSSSQQLLLLLLVPTSEWLRRVNTLLTAVGIPQMQASPSFGCDIFQH